jgi:adenylate kinase family enzyme
MRKVAIIASASGCGKTTFGRALAERLDARFVELDSLNHGPGWTEATAAELRACVEPIVAGDAWVIDGGYRGKLGDLVLDAADTVVWLDLPRRQWVPRLFRRTIRRIVRREELWGGNRETMRNAFFRRDGLLRFAWRNYDLRRARYPSELARFNVVRLRSRRHVDEWLASIPPATISPDGAARPPGPRGPLRGP